MRRIKPFPDDFPRNFDFCTPMSLQDALSPEEELYSLKCKVSESIPTPSSAKREIETDLGVKIKTDARTGFLTSCEYGSKDPDGGWRVSQKEIFEDIRSHGGVDDVVMLSRGSVHKIPEEVEDCNSFQGADEIYQQETARGNRTRKYKRTFNMYLNNPYRIIKADLLDHSIIKYSNDPVLKKMRSILVTDYILPSNEKGYLDLYYEDRDSENPYGILLKTERCLRERKFWKDTGIPKYGISNIDGTRLDVKIYSLDSRPMYFIGI